jgi:hypothetical protein
MSSLLAIVLALILQLPEDSFEPPPGLPDSIRLATARASEAQRLAEGLEELWPGLRDTPPALLLCLPDGNAVLLDHPGLPGWFPLDIREQDLPLSWWREGCPERDLGEVDRLWTLSASHTLDLEGRRTVWVDLAGELSSYRLLGASGEEGAGEEHWIEEAQAGGGSATEDAVGWIVRGLFQEWAEREMPAPPDLAPAPLNPTQRDQSRELAREEAALLAGALEAPSAREAREAGARFAEVRARRLDILGSWAPLLLYEEQMDGLALGTVYAALLLGRHDAGDIAPALLELEPDFAYEGSALLREDLLGVLGAEEGSGERTLPRPGLTGFGLVLLLDRTVHGWREAILENEGYLHELLAGADEGGETEEAAAEAEGATEGQGEATEFETSAPDGSGG